MSKKSALALTDDSEPIPEFLRKGMLSIVQGEGAGAAPDADATAEQPKPDEQRSDQPRAPHLTGTDIDVFRSDMEARRERSAATLRALDASFTDLEINRDQDIASIRERAIAEETAVSKRANDELADIAKRKAQHEAIVAGCNAALESSSK